MAYIFQKMFFIDQNLQHVHMTYSFLELLAFFWLTLVDVYSIAWSLFLTTPRNIAYEYK